MKRRGKMKPVMAWAIVHDDGAMARPFGVFSILGNRREARRARRGFGAMARIARVKITEIQRKP